jgi:transposase
VIGVDIAGKAVQRARERARAAGVDVRFVHGDATRLRAAGVGLAVIPTGGHRNDVTRLLLLLDAIPPIRGLRGRPRRRPGKVYADRGYDHDKYRQLLRQRGITPVIARRGTGHGSGLGRRRRVAERTFAWLTPSGGSAPATSAAPTPTRP